jgi:adenosylhomocysteine nucleosidase
MSPYHRIRLLTAPVALLFALTSAPDIAPAGPRTAIVGAFDEEVFVILSELEGAEVQEVLGIGFTVGRLHGWDVVVVESGVGKVNAAMTSAVLIDQFRPDEVIFTGIAGAVGDSVLPGDIVIGEHTVQHDLVVLQDERRERFGVRNPRDGTRNPVFLPADRRLLKAAVEASADLRLSQVETSRGGRVPAVVVGIIATGDAFVASRAVKAELRAELGADAVEMEGAAVAQVCHQLSVPCIVIRSISDEADENAERDLEAFYRTAAANSAALVLRMVELIRED